MITIKFSIKTTLCNLFTNDRVQGKLAHWKSMFCVTTLMIVKLNSYKITNMYP